LRSANHIAAFLCGLLASGCAPRARPRPEDAIRPGDVAGTAAPFFLLATATDGRWLVACQARDDTDGSGALDARVREDGTFTGDDLTPYLFQASLAGDGSGEPLIALQATSQDGRWLVVQDAGGFWLRDTLRDDRTRLEDGAPGASFDRFGGRLAYVKSAGGKAVAAILDLTTRQELLVDPGPGLLRAVRLDADGEMLNLWLDPPPIERPRSTPARRPGLRKPPPPPPPPPPPRPVCPSPADRAIPRGLERPAEIHRVLLLPDGRPIEVPGLLRTVGRALLRRGEHGELLVQDAQGFEVEWVPHDCGARVLQVDPGREAVLVACDGAAGDRPWSEVELHGTRVHRALGVEVPRGGTDTWLSRRPRLYDVPKMTLRAGQQEHVLRPGWVDLDRKATLPWEGRILWSEGGRALVRAESGRLWLVDVDLETSAPLDPPRPGESPLVAASPLVALDGVVVNVKDQTVLGEYPGRALALDRKGRVLVTTDPRGWGPARWVTPAFPR